MDAQLETDQARADKTQTSIGSKALTWPLRREARGLGPVHEYWQLPACVKVCFFSGLCITCSDNNPTCLAVAWCTTAGSCRPAEGVALPTLRGLDQVTELAQLSVAGPMGAGIHCLCGCADDDVHNYWLGPGCRCTVQCMKERRVLRQYWS